MTALAQWQKARRLPRTGPESHLAGEELWVRGVPKLLTDLFPDCYDVIGVFDGLHHDIRREGKRYMESNQVFDGKTVFVSIEALELLPDFAGEVPSHPIEVNRV